MSTSPTPHWRLAAFAQRCAIVAGMALLTFGVAAFLWTVGRGLMVVFTAVLLAVALSGLARLLCTYLRLPWGLALTVAVSAVVILSIGVLMLGGVRVAQQAPELAAGLHQAVTVIQEKLRDLGVTTKDLGLTSAGGIGSLKIGAKLFERHISTSMTLMTDTVVILVAGVYFAVNPGVYVRTIALLIPQHRRARFQEVAQEARNGLWRWLLGRFVAMLSVGVLTGVGLWLLGVNLALLLGVIAGALTFIPYLGSVISLIPAVLIGLLHSPMTAVYVALLFLCAHLLEGYVLSPLVQQHAVHLAPGWLITGQLLGGLLGGVFGVMIATPLLVVAAIVTQMLYIEDVLGEKVRILGE